jgi:hypothetical protein
MNGLSLGQLLIRFLPRRPRAPEARLQILNSTRQTVLATHIEVADKGSTRCKGLLGREDLPPGDGLWILPCEAVHTFGMRFPLDLVYLDRNRKIKKVAPCVSPWRMSACLRAHSVLELPAGTIRATHTQPGDILDFSPAPELMVESSVPRSQ